VRDACSVECVIHFCEKRTLYVVGQSVDCLLGFEQLVQRSIVISRIGGDRGFGLQAAAKRFGDSFYIGFHCNSSLLGTKTEITWHPDVVKNKLSTKSIGYLLFRIVLFYFGKVKKECDNASIHLRCYKRLVSSELSIPNSTIWLIFNRG
jgi:hypothetical protein